MDTESGHHRQRCFTFGGITAIALFRPTWWLGLLIAAVLATGLALDAADGQLARLRGGGSAAGEWLDHVVDAFKVSSIHVAVLICWYRFYELPSDSHLLIPIMFGLQSTVFYFAIMLTEQLRRSATGLSPSSPPVHHQSSPCCDRCSSHRTTSACCAGRLRS
jgi:phosphatidylglycerophosphate synthase